jgi:PAS domain S-box-containing protein
MMDITDRKRAEERLHKAHRELEGRVLERTADLESANQRLQREVSERKRTEEALRESGTYLKSILTAAPIGIGLVKERVIHWVSPHMNEMLGYSGDELVGKSARIVYPHDEEYERVGRIKYAQISEKGMGEIDTHMKCKDGSIIDINVKSVPIDPTDLSKGVIFTALEITDRNRAVKALRDSEERYRMLVETMNEGLSVIDEKGAFTFVNDRMCRMLGYREDELLGHVVTEFLDEENQRIFREQISEWRRGISAPYEGAFTQKDGRKIFTIISPQPTLDAEGAYKGSLTVITDITERKRVE